MSVSDIATFRKLIQSASLPSLGPGPRPDALSVEEINHRLDPFFRQRQLAPVNRDALRAAALLWNDHLQESHSISQRLQGPDGSFLHGIMHRREPDYGNAKYWFRHVGRHAAFEELATQVQARLAKSKRGAEVAARIIPRNIWEPAAFVDLCEESADSQGEDWRRQLLEEIQELEFDALLGHLLGGAEEAEDGARAVAGNSGSARFQSPH